LGYKTIFSCDECTRVVCALCVQRYRKGDRFYCTPICCHTTSSTERYKFTRKGAKGSLLVRGLLAIQPFQAKYFEPNDHRYPCQSPPFVPMVAPKEEEPFSIHVSSDDDEDEDIDMTPESQSGFYTDYIAPNVPTSCSVM